jgi:hypothetical protein
MIMWMVQRRCSDGRKVQCDARGSCVVAHAFWSVSSETVVARASERGTQDPATAPLYLKLSGSLVKVDDIDAESKASDVLNMLKFRADAVEHFKFPKLIVETTMTSDGKLAHVVQVPAESGFIPVVLLHALTGEDAVLAAEGPTECDCEPFEGTSVTHTGQLRLTSALIAKPTERMSASGLLQRILSHPVLSFLKGVDCVLAEQTGSLWTRVTVFDPESPPAKLGVIVRRSNVRIIDLMFGKASIPTVLRQDPGDTILDAVMDSCDWRTWLAVSALADDAQLVEAGGFIRLPGTSVTVDQPHGAF